MAGAEEGGSGGLGPLRFLELPSAADVSFWARLAELKLNEYKLSEEPIPVVGFYRASIHQGVASPLTLTSASFDLSTSYEVRQPISLALRDPRALPRPLSRRFDSRILNRKRTPDSLLGFVLCVCLCVRTKSGWKARSSC